MAKASRARRRRERLAGLRTTLGSTPAIFPALLAVVVFVAFAASEGGYPATTWYPGALLLLVVLVASLFVIPARRSVGTPVLVALGALVAYAGWAYLSIGWADQRGDAWDGANRALLYALVFGLFALWPLRAGAAAVVLGAFGLGVAGLGLVELLRVDAAADPAGYFVDARFSQPTGYKNANVALWFSGLLPCVFLAARREVHPLLRGVFLGGAGLLGGLALLGQSRGWLFVLPVVLIVYIVLVPARARALAAAAAVIAAVVAAADPILAVYQRYEPGADLPLLVDDAARAILLAAVVLTVLGAGAGLLDRLLIRPGPRTDRTGRVLNVAVLVALIVGLTGGLAAWSATGSPVGQVSDAWEEFKGGYELEELRGSRLTGSLGNSRYDFWTVAWDNFERRPLTGVGVDNFQQDYLARGTSKEQPRYAHSLPVSVLSGTGLIGALLLASALLAALLAAWLAVRRGSSLGAGCAAAGTVVFVYFFLHGSVDWLWEFPALGASAFAMLGLAAAVGAEEAGGAREERPRLRGPLAAAAVAVPALAMAVGFGLPWLAEREARTAARLWVAEPAEAFDRLDRAAGLNPASSKPDLLAAGIALRLNRLEIAERHFNRALQRDPRNAYAALQLGAMASQRGLRLGAYPLLARAVRLTPRDPVARSAFEAVARGRRLEVEDLNRRILEQARAKLN